MIETLTKYRIRTGQEFDTRQEAECAETLLDMMAVWKQRDPTLTPLAAAPAPLTPAPVSGEGRGGVAPRQFTTQEYRLAEIRDAIDRQALSGRALAKKAGISPGTLSDVLNAKVPLSEDVYRKILRAAVKTI